MRTSNPLSRTLGEIITVVDQETPKPPHTGVPTCKKTAKTPHIRYILYWKKKVLLLYYKM